MNWVKLIQLVMVLFKTGNRILPPLYNEYLEKQRNKKIRTILEAYKKKYTKEKLDSLYYENRSEFNRIFRLASDDNFRMYVEEQTDHKKAQLIIRKNQKEIEELKEQLAILQKEGNKNRRYIEELKADIRLYEAILMKNRHRLSSR